MQPLFLRPVHFKGEYFRSQYVWTVMWLDEVPMQHWFQLWGVLQVMQVDRDESVDSTARMDTGSEWQQQQR
jgi:hypothetical protein